MFQFLQKQALCKIYLSLLILFPLATQAQESSESGLSLPSGPIYTPQEPRLEFSYLETYDKPPDSKDESVVAKDRINQSTTTFVYVQIEMKNLLLGVKDQEYKLTFKYFTEGKELLGEYSTNFLIKKEWDYAWMPDSWGWDTPGKWPVGSHTVEVWINDTKFAVREFTILPS